LAPYATKNQNHPNITEIVFENDLEEVLNKNSQIQLQESLNIWAAIETFTHVFTVFVFKSLEQMFVSLLAL
jgi:hypothetical protein